MHVANLSVNKFGQPGLVNWFPVRRFTLPDGVTYDEVTLGRQVNGQYPLSVWLDRDQSPSVTRSLWRLLALGIESARPTFKGAKMFLKAPNAIVSENDIESKEGDVLLGFDTHYGATPGNTSTGYLSISSPLGSYQMLAQHRSAYHAGFVVVRPGFLAKVRIEHTGEQWNLSYPNQKVGLLLTEEDFIGSTKVNDPQYFLRRAYPRF